MAVSGRKIGDFTFSKRQESEEASELFCEPCEEDSKKLQAKGFCVDCCEYLCYDCYKHHCRARPFRYHVLQDEQEMPRSKPKTTKKVDIPDTSTEAEKCAKHKSHMIEFYCHSNDELCCGTCMFLNHRECKEIVHIEEEYAKFEERINHLQSQIDNGTTTKDQNSKETARCHSEATKQVKDFVADLKTFLEKLEKEITDLADNKKENDDKKLNKISQTCRTVNCDLETLTSELHTIHNLQQNGKLLKALEKAEVQIGSLEQTVKKINSENIIQNYHFQPAPELQDLKKGLKSLGLLAKFKKNIHNPENELKRDEVSGHLTIDSYDGTETQNLEASPQEKYIDTSRQSQKIIVQDSETAIKYERLWLMLQNKKGNAIKSRSKDVFYTRFKVENLSTYIVYLDTRNCRSRPRTCLESTQNDIDSLFYLDLAASLRIRTRHKLTKFGEIGGIFSEEDYECTDIYCRECSVPKERKHSLKQS